MSAPALPARYGAGSGPRRRGSGRVAPGRPAAERVVTRVDVIGPRFERRHDVPAERNAPIGPVLTVVLPLPEAGAAVTTAGTAVIGHLRDYHSMPFDLFAGIPGCLAFTISVTGQRRRSASPVPAVR